MNYTDLTSPSGTVLKLAGDERVVVLSPHLDDAALSLGATIATAVDAGCETLIATFFTAQPNGPLSAAAQEFHARCHLDDSSAVATRVAEDLAARAVLRSDGVHLGLEECFYRQRGGLPVHAAESSIFESTPEDESDVLDKVTEGLREVIRTFEPDLVFLPLGVGNHIDHLLVRGAAMRMRHASRAARWLAYEELPYVLFERCKGYDAGLEGPSLQVETSAAAWPRKLEAIGCYTSQLPILFEAATGWRQEVLRHATAGRLARPTERVWVSW